MPRMRLTEILRGGDANRLQAAWASTEAAADLGPLPAGEYICHVIGGELETGHTRGTPGYKLTFAVIDGEFKGRRVWHDIWLTEAALPLAKRDLGKLGVTSLEQLEQPLPQGIRCVVKVVLRRDDDGAERNRVKSFDVVGIDLPPVDPFAPAEDAPPEDKSPDDSPSGDTSGGASSVADPFAVDGGEVTT